MTAIQSLKAKVKAKRRITLLDLASALLQLDHRTDWSNGAFANIWKGCVQKYANALKSKPRKTIALTIAVSYAIHPYLLDILNDFTKHHKKSLIAYIEAILPFFT